MTNESPASVGPGLPKRILAFAGLPFLSLITPFIFLPLLARFAGVDAWVAIAVGQSIGAAFALVVALGYSTVGPSLVALASKDSRPEILASSLRARLVVFVPAVILSCLVAAAVAPASHRLDASLMSAAMTLSGLSSSWYMIGLGRAGLIAVYEILPRMVATILAVLPLIFLGDVTWYPSLLIGASLVSVIGFAVRTAGWSALGRPRTGELNRVVRENRTAVITEVAAGSYNSLAVTFVASAGDAAQAARYVSGDKLYRIGQYSVSALGNALQGWVVEESRNHFTRRVQRAWVLHAMLGVIGLVVFTLAGPELSGVLFGSQVAIDRMTAVGFGVATLGIALGTALGRVTLVGLGARREFMTSVLIGAAVGVPSILIFASLWGASGGAWGLALGEAASVTAQTIFVVRRWNTFAGPVA